MSDRRSCEERLAAALCAIVCDRGIRRYLTLRDPESLHQAQRALDDFVAAHVGDAADLPDLPIPTTPAAAR